MPNAMRELSKIRRTYDENREAYEALLIEVQESIRMFLAGEGLHPAVTPRLKEFDSYLEKRARLRKSQPRGPILLRDFFGIRIVCPFLNETEHVKKLLIERFTVTEVEHKGADRPVAEFGYESVHLSVRLPKGVAPTLLPHTKRLCEVQIRTILQDAWAQIEHELVYKADRSVPKSAIRRKLAAVSATLTLADEIFQETRDDLAKRHEQGIRRRESLRRLAFDEDLEPSAEQPLEASLIAMRSRKVADPRNRNLESLIVEALHAHSSDDLEQAIHLYTHLLRMRLPNADTRSMIYNHRGVARLTLARPALAVRDFSHALRWNANNFRAYFNRGLAHRTMGKTAMALSDFRRAVCADEVEGDSRYAIAQILARLGKRRQALAECDKTLALMPTRRGAKALREHLRQTEADGVDREFRP